MSKDFRGEIWANVDSRVMDAIVKANTEKVDGCVGNDSYSLKAIEYVQSFFKGKIYATYTINGTGANIIALKAMLDSYSAVICANETHINVYEAGAFEYTLGNKILSAESPDGKLTPTLIDKIIKDNKKYKYNPKVVVITQPTEFGTVYTPEELKVLCDHVHSLGMYLYIDGARIGTALASLNCTLTEIIEYPDVDAFTVGGTKSGAMFGEMVVFRREEFSRALPYLQKQSFQHFDKSKFIGVQFCALFENDLWIENARKANEGARLLEKEFAKKGVLPYYPVEANMFFGVFTKAQLDRMTEVFDLHYWNEDIGTVRIAATQFTDEKTVKLLTELI